MHGYQAVGWTVPLLTIHFAEVEGVPVSETTLRRVLCAFGYRWKRSGCVLARRDPEWVGKTAGARVGDRPGPRRRVEHRSAHRGRHDSARVPVAARLLGNIGQPVEVPTKGSNTRRVVSGALNPFTGTSVCTVAPRNTGTTFLQMLRGTYKRSDIMLLLDRGWSHIAKATAALGTAFRHRLAWLPTACPELKPVEAL